MPIIDPLRAGGKNVCAFLDMTRISEIGSALLAKSDNGYNVLVGSTPEKPLLFTSYADHPNVFNKTCDSDAAGGYQIMHKWWPAYKAQLKLPDFCPLSQDLYAIQQIRESRALAPLIAGDIETAISLCAHIWASFTGAGYQQHENSLDFLRAAYVQAGGVVGAPGASCTSSSGYTNVPEYP
jgi:muramidase (phage lysozyme)